MIYALSVTSQSRLLARVSTERQRRIYTLAQRRHIVTLVDRAVQEDGVSFNRAVDNLQVSAQSVRRWRAATLQDTTNPRESRKDEAATMSIFYLRCFRVLSQYVVR